MHVHELIRAHPNVGCDFSGPLARCIEDCYACSQTCVACADACLAEQAVAELRQCVRLNLDCADVCIAMGNLASRCTGANERLLLQMLDSCACACQICAEECERHASHHEHCRICAEECRRCEEACRMAMQDVGGASGRVQTN
jgi:hypothetical protein